MTLPNGRSAGSDTPSMSIAMSSIEKPPRLPPQFELVALDRTVSVTDAALAIAEDGAGEGTLVWAREQTNACTRRGNAWIGYAGNLHCALIIEPDYPNDESWQLALRQRAGGGQRHRGDGLADDGPALQRGRTGCSSTTCSRPGSTWLPPTRRETPTPRSFWGRASTSRSHPPQPEPEEFNSVYASGAPEKSRSSTCWRRTRAISSPGRAAGPRKGFAPIAPGVAHPGRRDSARRRADPADGGVRCEGRVDDIDEGGALVLETDRGSATDHDRRVLRPRRGAGRLTVHGAA